MDWAYVTGYFDGEGSILFYLKPPNAYHCGVAWYNTHLASLEAMRAFMACGRIRSRSQGVKRQHVLYVERRADLLRILPRLIRHSLIKRDSLIRLLDYVRKHPKGLSPGFGRLAVAGRDEIEQLYWKEQLSQSEIARKFGVTQGAVKMFMHRRGIPVRDFSTASRLAKMKMDPDAELKRREKIATAHRRLWKQRAYRTKVVAAVRAGQARRLASRRLNRPNS